MVTLGPGLVAAASLRPRQDRIRRGSGMPDQPVEQTMHLGNRQGYQGFIPFLLSPSLPPEHSFACRLTNAK